MDNKEFFDWLLPIEVSSRSLDVLIHKQLGWHSVESWDECSVYTPGAVFNPGTDCYESLQVRWIPDDVHERYRQMLRDECGPEDTPPSPSNFYSEKIIEDWWLGDERDEYPKNYTTNVHDSLKYLPDYAILDIHMGNRKNYIVLWNKFDGFRNLPVFGDQLPSDVALAICKASALARVWFDEGRYTREKVK